MNYQAITETNSESIFGFVTISKAASEHLFAEFSLSHYYDSWSFEGEVMYCEFLDNKFNGHLPCACC
jgi:hypothetical protein